MSTQCDCSLIIPTLNRRDILRETLSRIVMLPDHHYEIIVVDNGSTDDTVQSLKPAYPRVRWIQLKENQGSAARNVAAEVAKGRVLLMLDDDSWPAPGVIEGVVSLFDQRLDLGAIACRVRLADPPQAHDAGGVPASSSIAVGLCEGRRSSKQGDSPRTTITTSKSTQSVARCGRRAGASNRAGSSLSGIVEP